MKKSWVEQLDKQVEIDIRSNYIASLLTRKRLAYLLSEKIKDSNRLARSKSSYDTPNWALLQADQRGFERALTEVIDLIIEVDKEKPLP